MTLVWSRKASYDLEAIVAYIAMDNENAAARVAKRIVGALEDLVHFPHRGRKREDGDGRELIFTPWPYIAVYEVRGETIYIRAVRHAARKEP